MTIGFLFWLLMILWALTWLGVITIAWAGPALLFILLFLLGWKVFGFPIQG